MEQRRNKLGEMPIGKLVANISVPLIISLLVQSLYNIVDGMFVAKISEDALTATSLAFPMQMIMISVSVGASVGVNSLLSRTLGKKDYSGANAVAVNGLFISAIHTIVFMLLGIFAVPLFLRAFTDETQILQMGTTYLRICMLFCIGHFFAAMGERLLQATGNTLLSMAAQLSGAIINLLFDPIFIFGWIGFPKMGIAGAAAATVLGQCSAAVIALVLNLTKNKDISLTLRGFKPNGKIIGEVYKVGVPSMCVTGMGSVMMIGMNKILIPFTNTAVAFFGVYYKLQSFVFMPINGLSQGLIPIVGYNYGAKNGSRVRDAIKVTFITAICIMLFGTTLFWIGSEKLLTLYSATDEMMAFGATALRVLSATFVFVGVYPVVGYAFAGMGNGMVNMVCAVLRQGVMLIPCAMLFAHLGGLELVWYAVCISDFTAAAVAIIWLLAAYPKKIKPLL